MLFIYDYLVSKLQKHLDKCQINATIEPYIGRAWHCYRYIQVHPIGITKSVHYEYINGHWELHFENYDNPEESEKLRRKVMNEVCSDGYFDWHRTEGTQRGYLNIEQIVEEDTFLSLFDELYNKTIHILLHEAEIEDGGKEASVICADEVQTELLNEQLFNIVQYQEYHEPNIRLSSVGELDFGRFVIPPYQRPYKWSVKNVNQLINDIITFCDKQTNEYRLGTLVLHQNDNSATAPLNIVDGQQRSITLILLMNELRKEYSELFQEIQFDTFLTRSQFHESTSRHHIKENINAIRFRLPEFSKEHVRFLLRNCKFVVVTLFDISEAFQFFDSQNARGKELEPHDLLKAFHLREIPTITETDRKNILDWESLDTPRLANLFLILFRIKRWIEGKDGREFTASRISTFKGPKVECYSLPYQRIYLMAKCYTELYNADLFRKVDRQHMEFPHQIDQITLNGTLFFDMIRYYAEKERIVKELLANKCEDIHNAISTYPERNRQGDIYTRNLFFAALMFYYDKFGEEGFCTAVPKIFAWAYGMRIRHYSVQLATMDNYARDGNSFFKMLHQAISPSDIQNWKIVPIKDTENAQNGKMETITGILTKYKYIE